MNLVVAFLSTIFAFLSPQCAFCVTIEQHQAEEAFSIGSVAIENGPNQGYTGSGYANFHGGQGAFLLWIVNAPFEGEYHISIRYASPNQRPMDLYVDNIKQLHGYQIKPTADWNTWTQESVAVRLTTGSHQIKVAQLTNAGPNIDWMTIEGPMDGRSTVLEPDQVLNPGEFRYSPRQLFKAGLDDSGQLVIQEGSSSSVIWSSGNSEGSSCYMQRDGNLVVRDGMFTVSLFVTRRHF